MANRDSGIRRGGQIRTLFSVGALGAMTDGALLEHFTSGGEASEPAFAVLVGRHGSMVLRVCRRLLGDDHLAEDAFQVTFLVLARRARTIRNPDALVGWLHRTARRVALRARLQTDRRRSRERPDTGRAAIAAGDPLERDEIRTIVFEEIDRLGKTHRLPIVLCVLEGLTHEEAARRLRWPVGTVKSRLVRGRRRLEGRLSRRGLAPAAVLAGLAAETSASTDALVFAAMADAAARSAVRLAKGASIAETVSASVTSLFEKELSAMFLARLKLIAGATLATSTAILLVGLAVALPVVPGAPGIESPAQQKVGASSPTISNTTSRAEVITLLVLDPHGQPVAGAEVVRHRRGFEDVPQLRTDAAGHCDLTGIDRKRGATIDVLHSRQLLGTRLELRPEESPALNPEGLLELRLQPIGWLAGRILDEDGKPIIGPEVSLFTKVRYPEKVGNRVESVFGFRDDGTFSIGYLIAGAEYQVEVRAEGHASLFSEHVRAKSAENVRLKEFRLPVTNQELRGIVVNPRGQRIAGAMVSFEANADRQLVPPGSAIWFQETDAEGQFHLSGLPKGLLTVATYRNPKKPDVQIKNLVRDKIQAGRTDVRIVLPDVNERLRGIE